MGDFHVQGNTIINQNHVITFNTYWILIFTDQIEKEAEE